MMKKILLIPMIILCAITANAQAPQAFKYQTILRNASGETLANQAVSLRLSILQGSETGVAVYTETWNKTTNAFGLIVLNVGEGTSSDDFAGIEWGANLYYLKAEIDQTGGTNYTDAGTSQLLSVPYAIYANQSANGTSQWVNNNTSIYYNEGNVGIGTATPGKKLVIKATNDTDTLMEILDKDGNPLMVITPQLTKFNIIKDPTKAASGGFAVGRYALAKKGKAVENNNLLLVTTDSTRIYTIQETTGAAGTSGGFAVGRYALAKGDTIYNFFTDVDSTKVIIPGEESGIQGGFAIMGSIADSTKNIFDIGSGEIDSINNENRMLWYPKKNAFLAGFLNVTADSVGENSLNVGYKCSASGNYASATGYQTIANGLSSTATGRDTKATGFASTAMGYQSKAKGQQSTAMGYEAEASGNNSTAIGSGAKALYESSIAIGNSTTASGRTSIAMGQNTTASGDYSTAMGFETLAEGNNSTAMGCLTTASGLYSTAMGANTTASGDHSTAMGSETTASGNYSTAMGTHIKAKSKNSFGIGLYDISNTNIDSITQDNTMAIMGGKVGIDTVAPDKTFVVNGDARITGDIFYGTSGTDIYSKPDFVFEKNYPKQYDILETEKFIIKNKHLPWLTSAKDEKDGINLTRMNFETLEAVENQQLQIISLKKENKNLEKEIQELKKANKKFEQQTNEIQDLKQEIEALKKLIQK